MHDAGHWKKGQAMQAVYTGEPVPESFTRAIFLAGPSPRVEGESWRTTALEILERLNYDGVVYNPEYRENKNPGIDYDTQIEWEEEAMNRCDCIVFWVPRDIYGGKLFPQPMAALTTNDEWGTWKHSGKCVFGAPPEAEKVGYQLWWARHLGVPIREALEATLQCALSRTAEGALRMGGECEVPLEIWNRNDFQAWLSAQKAVGNRLDGCRVEWTFRIPRGTFEPAKGRPRSRLFSYVLHVNVHIEAEDRNKTNEVVSFRPDISAVVMYGYGAEAEVVLVKEFRSSVRNEEGFVYELPGGSSKDPNEDPREVAVEEVLEETGLRLSVTEVRPLGSRQINATGASYHCNLFRTELTPEQLEQLRSDSSAHGVEGDSERTYVEVVPMSKIIRQRLVDWSQMGMIFSALHDSWEESR